MWCGGGANKAAADDALSGNMPESDDTMTVTDQWPTNFGGPHVAGCQFVLADGSCRLINYQIDNETFRRLSLRQDGQPVGEF